MSVVVVATVHPAAGQLEDVTAAFLEVMPLVHAENGCELYALHRSADQLIVIEKWVSEAALQAHASGDVVAMLRSKIQARTSGPTEVQVLHPLSDGTSRPGAL